MFTQDDPRQRPADPEPDWVTALQQAVRCKKILESANNDLKVVWQSLAWTQLLIMCSAKSLIL